MGWLTRWLSRIRLICAGAKLSGTARQDASKCRIVALSSAPTLNIAEAEEWIASKASLLNLRFVVMAFSLIADLKPILLQKQSIDLLGRQLRVNLRELPETVQFVVPDVCPVFLGEQIFIHPKLPSLG